ncbi:LuxR family transcriptional regulator [Duganella sp. HSC-15S17]|uniref:LuxR family transcriptional regulator n=1 Tax=Duganella violaceipulchra TaxID=2849652 RepID=A0AA41HA25_9BURK|nr:LuxR family transcriptional regulator [Duganella violaceicalia]MBV6322696.1 LuxR family transcriptional regulator [Duganella violaceicalia]
MLDFKVSEGLTHDDVAVVAGAADWRQLRTGVKGVLARLGVAQFMLKLDVKGSEGSLSHVVGTLPAPMLNLFANREHAASDPIGRQLLVSGLPLRWQPAKVAGPAPTIYPLLDTSGIVHALSLMVRSGQAASRIDFYGDSVHPFATTCVQQASLVLLGLYLHDRAEILWRERAQQPAALLSKRELECIHWSAAGKTSREIGLILGISQRTAYFHLTNVATKLNVHTTRHAISRAIALGLLST